MMNSRWPDWNALRFVVALKVAAILPLPLAIVWVGWNAFRAHWLASPVMFVERRQESGSRGAALSYIDACSRARWLITVG